MRDSFIFYRSFYESIKELPLEDQGAIYSAICEYSLNKKEPDFSGIKQAIFTLIKPQIDANHIRYENGKIGGKHGVKGGRPKKENPKKTPKEPQENPKETPNVNENGNVNVNVNGNEVNVNGNIWKDFEALRKVKKAPITDTVINNIGKEADKAGWTFSQALEEMVVRGWTGFKADWVNKTDNKDKPKSTNPQLNPADFEGRF